MRLRSILLAGAMAFAAAAAAAPAGAVTFKWANDGDSNSMDPYARQETFLLSFDQNIYDPLVRRGANFKLEPALAKDWKRVAPTTYRFNLRPGVKWQDGTPFTADDVIFSYERAAGPGSNVASDFVSVKEMKKIDDLTIEVETKVVDPVFVEQITAWGIMSKAWATAHNAQKTADLTKNEENYATRNAMGTGPYMLKSREPDVRTVLEANPNWWDKRPGNVTEAIFNRIANDSTRVAALLSGEVDFVYTVPPQDVERIRHTPGTKIEETPELRTVYLGFDVARPELLESNIKGKNPYQDKRVRQAFYLAIDVNAIQKNVMQGQSHPSTLMVGPGVSGYNEKLDVRAPYDPEKAKKLLADAGYPNGFETGMDCPNDRYVNDARICQAVVAMLAKINIKVNLLAQTRAKYFAKILGPGYNTSFFMLGWTPITVDAHNAFENLLHTRNVENKIGTFNVSGWSNAKFDSLVDTMKSELDSEKRLKMIDEANEIVKDELPTIPLHQQIIVWAMKSNVNVVETPDNFFQLRHVVVK
ncbi:MAG TPA: ABC transporter substrate-binding protein [Candidatus Cybelea sp.]|nr:ABC transporter substrate-binding protein [Candidatus Cybelea sp.]